jgi:Flp pilus assembly pilin Flp
MQTKQQILRFVREESGQTTTEYVLILAVILTIIMQFKKKLYAIVVKLMDGVGNDVDKVREDF